MSPLEEKVDSPIVKWLRYFECLEERKTRRVMGCPILIIHYLKKRNMENGIKRERE